MRCVFPSKLLNGALALWMSVFVASTGSAVAGASMAGQASVHEVTGQAAVTAEVTPERARRLALEDALYLAALQGGVAIDGFSAMDASTTLSEETVLRPSAEILDQRGSRARKRPAHVYRPRRTENSPQSRTPRRRGVRGASGIGGYSEDHIARLLSLTSPPSPDCHSGFSQAPANVPLI